MLCEGCCHLGAASVVHADEQDGRTILHYQPFCLSQCIQPLAPMATWGRPDRPSPSGSLLASVSCGAAKLTPGEAAVSAVQKPAENTTLVVLTGPMAAGKGALEKWAQARNIPFVSMSEIIEEHAGEQKEDLGREGMQ